MKPKQNLRNSAWTQNGEGGIGTSIVRCTKTVTNQQYVLKTIGYVVLLDAHAPISLKSLGVNCKLTTVEIQSRKIQERIVTGQTFGSVSMCWNPMSREWTTSTSTDSDGVGSQEDLESHQESSSHTSMRTEQRSSSSRFDTLTEATAVLRSHQAANQQFMERSV